MMLALGLADSTRKGKLKTKEPAFTIDPTLTGTPEIGQVLSVAFEAEAVPLLTAALQWFRDGAPLAGETGESYLLAPEDDGAAITCEVRLINTYGSVLAVTPSLTATYPVAVAAGALADVTLTQGDADLVIDAGADFTGAVGGVFSVTGGGAVIDAATGQLTLSTGALRAAEAVVISYTNSGGVAQSGFGLTVEALPLPVFQSAPSLTGTPEIGQVLGVAYEIAAGTQPGVALQWQRGGVAIQGETGASYTLAPIDDLSDISCEVVLSAPGGETRATSPALTVTYPVAVAAGTLADVTLTQGDADLVIDAGADFTGAVGGVFSVTGGGAVINAATGQLTLSAGALRAGEAVVVRYTNSGGTAQSGFALSVLDGPGYDQMVNFGAGANGLTLTSHGIGVRSSAVEDFWVSCFFCRTGSPLDKYALFFGRNNVADQFFAVNVNGMAVSHNQGTTFSSTVGSPEEGHHVLTAHFRKNGNGGEVRVLLDGVDNGGYELLDANMWLDDWIGGGDVLAIGHLADSTPGGYVEDTIYSVSWGTGDPAAFHAASYNGGALTNPASYDFAADAACLRLGHAPLMRDSSLDASAFDPAQLGAGWAGTGALDWIAATPVFDGMSPVYAAPIPPALVGGASGTWALTQGTGLQVMDAAPLFAGDALSYALSPATAGVSIDAAGVITADSDALAGGDTSLTVTASGPGGSVDYVLTLSVAVAVAAPSLTGAGAGVWDIEQNTGVQVQDAAPLFAGDSLSYALSPSVAGLSIDAAGVLSADSAVLATGTTVITITASNSAGSADFVLDLTLSVPVPAPVLTGAASGSWTLTEGTGQSTLDLAGTFMGTGLSYAISPAMAGLSIDAAGVITADAGVLAVGNSVITVTASNMSGSVDYLLTVSLAAAGAAPALSGAASGTWAVAQGSGLQETDLSGVFSGTNLSFAVSGGEDFEIDPLGRLSVDTDVLDGAPIDLVVTASNPSGTVDYALSVSVGAFHPANLFAANPSWEGFVVDPSAIDTLSQDEAGSLPIIADGDLIARIDANGGAGTLVRSFVAEDRTYIDDGINPPYMGGGVFRTEAPISVGANFYFGMAVSHDSNGADSAQLVNAMKSAYDNRFSLNIGGNRNPSMTIPTVNDGAQVVTSSEQQMPNNKWVVASAYVQDLEYGFSVSADTVTGTLPSAMTPFTDSVTFGGRIRNGSANNRVKGKNGPVVAILNATPSDEQRGLIDLWLAQNSLGPSPRPYFFKAPSIVPEAPVLGDTLTLDAGIAFGTPDPGAPVVQYFLDGADVTAEVASGTYVLPVAGARQFVMVTTFDNGFNPPAIDVTHVELDSGAVPAGDDPAETFPVTKYAHDGVLFDFGAMVDVGHYVAGPGAGDIFVLDTGAGIDVSFTPGPLRTDDAQPRQINGAMLNPRTDQKTGYDSYSWSANYTPDNNVSLGGTIHMKAGDTLVVGISNLNKELSGKRKRVTDRFVVVTCVDTVPYHDEFRPPYTWPVAAGPKPCKRLSDVDFAKLPALPSPGGTPAADAFDDVFRRPQIDTEPNFNRDFLDTLKGNKMYGRELLRGSANMVAYMASDATVADKRQAVINFVQAGIDRYGVLRDAKDQGMGYCEADGGHNSFRKFSILVSGWLLGDLEFQTWVDSNTWQEDDMVLNVTQEIVDISNGIHPSLIWAPSYGAKNGSEPYQQGMADGPYPMPEWVGDVGSGPTKLNAKFNAHPYRMTGNHEDLHACVLFLLAAGLKPLWNKDVFFDYHMRHWNLRSGNDDPWRFQGGTAPLYNQVSGISTTTFSGWAYNMFTAHIGSLYSYPWE